MLPVSDAEYICLFDKIRMKYQNRECQRRNQQNIEIPQKKVSLKVADTACKAGVTAYNNPEFRDRIWNSPNLQKFPEAWQRAIQGCIFNCGIGACTALIVGIINGDSTPNIIANSGISAMYAGLGGGIYAFGNVLITQFIETLKASGGINISALSLFLTADFCFGLIITVLDIIYQLYLLSNEGFTWANIHKRLKILLDDLAVNIATIGVSSLAACMLPFYTALATILTFSVVVSMLHLRCDELSPGDSFAVSVWKGLRSIPMMLFAHGSTEIMLDCMLDSKTKEVLDDPVFVKGVIVSRSTAQRRQQTGLDFWNGPMTADDIVSMPELAELVQKYRKYRTYM